MININLQNVEELILKNSNIKSLLPDLRYIYDKWLLSYRFPALNTMRKEALIEFLNSLNETHIEKLAKFFKDMVFVTQLDYHIVKNIKVPVTNKELTKYESYANIAISRSADDLYITLWR